MPLTLTEQATLAADAAYQGRVEAAIANYAAYVESLKANTPPESVALVAALSSWSTQVMRDPAERAAWSQRLRWYGVRKAVTDNVTLAQAQASSFDGGLAAEIETQIRRAHGVA